MKSNQMLLAKLCSSYTCTVVGSSLSRRLNIMNQSSRSIQKPGKGSFTLQKKIGSGPVKKVVRTDNSCEEILEFPQDHRRLLPVFKP